MEAPRSRYRVEEKDGRLVVIDTATGERARPPASPAPAHAHAEPAALDRPTPSATRFADVAADFLAKRAVKGADAQGRAILAWEWEVNGRKERWDASLDGAQQRRLGRALLAFVNAAVVASFLFVLGLPLLGLFFAVPFIVRGWWGLKQLRAETGPAER